MAETVLIVVREGAIFVAGYNLRLYAKKEFMLWFLTFLLKEISFFLIYSNTSKKGAKFFF